MNFTKIRRVEKAITNLQKMGLLYLWGGARLNGHMTPPTTNGQGWTDCSGFVEYLLAVANISNHAGSTFSLATEGQEGRGEIFTLFIKNEPVHDAHVIIRLRKRPRPWHFGKTRYRWAECGGSDNPRPGGGPSWFTPGAKQGRRPEDRIAEFPIHRNFDKQFIS